MSKIFMLAGSCLLALSAAACGSGETAAAPATSSAPVENSPPSAVASPAASAVTGTPAGIAPVGPGAAIAAERQFVFATTQSGGRKMLTVGEDGILTTTDHLDDRSYFVTTPIEPGGDKYLMQTARIVQGDEPWCLAVHSPGGSASLQLKTVACDAGKADQIFTFPKSSDGKGRMIAVGDLFVMATADDKIIAQESGEGDGLTSFTVRDQGKSTLPHLGD